MATSHLKPATAAAPIALLDLSAVELWLTRAIEHDYSQRRVFPSLRMDRATKVSGGAALYLLSPTDARLVMADATERMKAVARQARTSFASLISALAKAIDDATHRPAQWAQVEPTKIAARYGDDEWWTGTRDQLKTLGISVFPGDAGQSKRWVRTRTAEGREALVSVGQAAWWPGLFQARISPLAKAPEPEDMKHWFNDWCEAWEGTKEQFQAIGIGVGQPFPGETGAPLRMTFTDLDGIEVVVYTHSGDKRSDVVPGYRYGGHSGYLDTNYSTPAAPWRDFCPGVSVRAEYFWTDEYLGTLEALVAAGLAKRDQFPGTPGRGTFRASYQADGLPACSGRNSRAPGGKTIERAGKTRYRVSIVVAAEEEARRRTLEEQKEIERKKQMADAKQQRMALRGLAGSTPKRDDLSEEDCSMALTSFLEMATRAAKGECRAAKVKDEDEARAFLQKRAKVYLDALWRDVLCARVGAGYSLDLGKDTDAHDEVAEAFSTLRNVVREADMSRDKAAVAAEALAKKSLAARADPAFMAFLQASQRSDGEHTAL